MTFNQLKVLMEEVLSGVDLLSLWGSDSGHVASLPPNSSHCRPL